MELSHRRIQPYHKNIPYIGHKRLVTFRPSSHGWRVNQSSVLGQMDRIYHKVRPHLAYQPMEDYLTSRPVMAFDDETRSIRAKTAEIMRRIHTPVPRAQRPLHLPGDLYYSHTQLPITERITSDNYIDRILSSYADQYMPTHNDPNYYSKLGKGHLACLTYAGGRPILRRRNLASGDDYIRNDINVLSHYSRFRQAAENASHEPNSEYDPVSHPPPSMSSVTGSWKSNAPRRTHSDKVLSKPRTPDETDSGTEKKKSRREAVEEETWREAEEEKRRAEELERQEELAKEAALERQAELERKAREKEEEEERILREEEERSEALKNLEEEEDRRQREAEEQRIVKEEEERKAEEERLVREEEEKFAREEEERLAKEEEERLAREEEERLAKEEEEERLAREEEERLAKEEEEERLAREEEERLLMEEEEERLKAEEKEEKSAEEPPAGEEEENEESEVAKALSGGEESDGEPMVEEPTSPDEVPAKVFTEDEEEAGGGEEDEEEEE